MATRQSTEERFWSKVMKLPDAPGCWLWMASTNSEGYGWFRMPSRAHLAPRISWALTYGPVPDGICVLHRCDTPPCVNPAHLFLGTDGDNSKDRDMKGRTARGVMSGQAKLTEEQVLDARTSGDSNKILSARLGVSLRALFYVKKRVTWTHLA